MTARVVSTVQIGNYAILEGPENGRHCPKTKNSRMPRFTTIESILPDRSSLEGSRIGGLRQNLVCLTSRFFAGFLGQVTEGKRTPESERGSGIAPPKPSKIRLRRKPAPRVHSSNNI